MRSTRNRHACMIKCMNVDEARGVCKEASLPISMGKRREFMYVCMYVRYMVYVESIDNATSICGSVSMFWELSWLHGYVNLTTELRVLSSIPRSGNM